MAVREVTAYQSGDGVLWPTLGEAEAQDLEKASVTLDNVIRAAVAVHSRLSTQITRADQIELVSLLLSEEVAPNVLRSLKMRLETYSAVKWKSAEEVVPLLQKRCDTYESLLKRVAATLQTGSLVAEIAQALKEK